MTYRPHSKLAFVTTAIFLTPSTLVAGGLCKSNEDSVFSCGVRNDRIVSICRATEVVPNKLIYRFGSQHNIELEHADDVGPESSFFYGFYFRYLTEYFNLGFKRGGYTYSIFYRYNEDFPDPSYTLFVEFPGDRKKSISFECLRSVEDAGLREIRDVSCSTEEAIGCDARQ